ncbi:hypothetical protein, partial [Escherichia coli]|uniref:hypothetical protein n=1 Tax=Escherichia coli TaxID=562 RepID=UPI003D120D6D
PALPACRTSWVKIALSHYSSPSKGLTLRMRVAVTTALITELAFFFAPTIFKIYWEKSVRIE